MRRLFSTFLGFAYPDNCHCICYILIQGTVSRKTPIAPHFICDIMGNAQARQRIKARDFDYLAKFTGFATEEVKCCIKWKVRSLLNVDV